MGIDENTPVYTWKAVESNAICSFLTPQGMVMERMFLKNGRYFSTGWINSCEYGKDSMINGELSFYTVKRIKPSGLYSGK